jgi:cytochrome P450
LLTHLVHRLLEYPDLFAAVQQDRELVAPLIEESLRHDSPVPATSRRLTTDTEVGGCPMHKGEWIEVGVMAANHDDDVYADADEFRLDRPDARDHLGFGTGPHVCPGATLARLEARTAVTVLLDGLAGMRRVEGAEYPPLPSMLDHRPVPAHLLPLT